ncbi:MAG: TIGR02281 family clan AA aspartic protease [Pseudomonadota bacterium]
MSLKDAIIALAIAGAIAAAVKYFVSPETSASAPSVSTAVTEPAVPDSANQQPDPFRRSAVLTRKNDGHYWARSVVNKKTSVEFMVDTGASVVALTYKDAQRMGLRPDTLDYRWTINTAGGQTKGASVLIESMKVGQVHIRDVEAMVLRSDLEHSLLGMSFLSKLYSYEFRGDRMLIRQ